MLTRPGHGVPGIHGGEGVGVGAGVGTGVGDRVGAGVGERVGEAEGEGDGSAPCPMALHAVKRAAAATEGKSARTLPMRGAVRRLTAIDGVVRRLTCITGESWRSTIILLKITLRKPRTASPSMPHRPLVAAAREVRAQDFPGLPKLTSSRLAIVSRRYRQP